MHPEDTPAHTHIHTHTHTHTHIPSAPLACVLPQLQSTVTSAMPTWSGVAEVFMKEQAYRFESFLDTDTLSDVLPEGFIHTFLIRHPAKTIVSFWDIVNKGDTSESHSRWGCPFSESGPFVGKRPGEGVCVWRMTLFIASFCEMRKSLPESESALSSMFIDKRKICSLQGLHSGGSWVRLSRAAPRPSDADPGPEIRHRGRGRSDERPR